MPRIVPVLLLGSILALAPLSAGARFTAPDELRTHAQALAASDENIHAIVLSPQKVALEYQVPTKLFGLISVEVPVSISVDTLGSASVEYPWYGFLLTSEQAALAIRSQAAVQDIVSEKPHEDNTFSTGQETRILDSLHTVMQEHAATRLAAQA